MCKVVVRYASTASKKVQKCGSCRASEQEENAAIRSRGGSDD